MKRSRTDYTLEFRQEAVRLVLAGQRQAMDEIMEWLTFYNHKRPHLTPGYVSPMTFEADCEIERKKSGEEGKKAA